MGVRVLHDADEHAAVLYDSVSMFAFGPLFGDSDQHCLSAEDNANAFLRWNAERHGRDPRTYTDAEIESVYMAWCVLLDEHPDTTADWTDLADNLAAVGPTVGAGTPANAEAE